MPGGKNRAHRPLERSGCCCWYVSVGQCGEGEEFGVWSSRRYTGGVSEAMGVSSGSWLGLSVMGRWTAEEQERVLRKASCGMCRSCLGAKENKDGCLDSLRDR